MTRLGSTVLACMLALSLGICSSALGARPVDNDGDGVKSNQDCNDNNEFVYPDAPELCDGIDNQCPGDAGYGQVDEGCGGCTPTGTPETICNGVDDDCDDLIDEDWTSSSTNCGVGVCSATGSTTCVDGVEGDTCTPGSPTEPTEATCDDTLDNDCDGLTDGADSDCGGTGSCTPTTGHDGLLFADYPNNCLSCHSAQANEMADSTHYKWVGDTPDMVNQGGTQQGKLTNAVNSYCINIAQDWGICGKCHAGRGLAPNDPAADNTNIDCLVCHNAEYAAARDRIGSGAGSMTVAAPNDCMVQEVTKPVRSNCLKCHATAGGGDAVKRGDLSMATATNADPHFDVHMNTTGADLTCQACHVFQNHKVIGKGSDLRPTDDTSRGSEISCSTATCHPGMDSGTGHAAAGANRSEGDRHVFKVSCQACHVDVYAKVATENQMRLCTCMAGGESGKSR